MTLAAGLPLAARRAPPPPWRRAGVVRESTDHARWEMVHARPHPGLAGIVDGAYCGWWETSTRPFRRLEVPSSLVPLLLNLGPPLLVAAPGTPTEAVWRGAFTAGLCDAYALTESHGLSLGLQVNLTPLAAHRVLGLPMHALTNRIVALADVLGATGDSLLERLGNARSWEERFATVDSFLLDRLAGGGASAGASSIDGVAWAWERLRASAGRTPIASLVRELGWSHRRLIASFRERVGLAPKTAARVLRFQATVAALSADRDVDWADVALACGYFDQSHLIRDFAAFAGTTPVEFRRRLLPEGGGVSGDTPR